MMQSSIQIVLLAFQKHFGVGSPIWISLEFLWNDGAGLSAIFCRQRNWGYTVNDVSKVTNESAAKPHLEPPL